MRFKWRRRLAVTAFALGSMLPFAGCSSQQQQVSDEVAAEGQQQQEGDQQMAESQQQEGDQQMAESQQQGQYQDEEVAQGSQGYDTEGENVVSNELQGTGEESGDGSDLQSMITEMNGSDQGQAVSEDVAQVEDTGMAAGVEEVAPMANGGEAVPAEAAPVAESAPVSEAVAAPGMPEMGSKMAYVVEAGDTLGKIAVKIYGDQKRWRDIANLSGMENPNHIYPGDVVYYSLEDSSSNFAAAYESMRRSKEIVQEGDTLAAISKRVYGTSKAWRHIWRQNDGIDNPDELTAGMVIYYVESGAFKAAMTKIKGFSVAKAAKTSLNKVFKSAQVGQKASVTAQAHAFIGFSV